MVRVLNVSPAFESNRKEGYKTNENFYGDGYTASSDRAQRVSFVEWSITAYSTNRQNLDNVVNNLIATFGSEQFILNPNPNVLLGGLDAIRLYRCRSWSVETLNKNLHRLRLAFFSNQKDIGSLLIQTGGANLLESDGLILLEDF